LHAEPIVRSTVLLAAPLSKLRLVGFRLPLHAVACVAVNVWLAIVSVPERPGPSFAATENVTVPLPEPLAPDLMVIQDALLALVQAQPATIVTVIGPPAPPEVGNP
jgi:hypothetical protein